MLTIPDLSKDAVQNALKQKLKYVEDERVKERDYLLDFYEGINVEHYVGGFFGAETLRQVVTPQNNLTKRVCTLRAMTYKKPPRLRTSDAYIDTIDIHSLNAQRRLLERLTFLLGTMAFRSKWNERTQKIEYETLPHFQPLFLAGESRDKPVGIVYPIEFQGNARNNDPVHAVWTEARNGQPGQHYLVDESARIISVNDQDLNPYGLMPVTFCHRYPPIRDFDVGNALDVAQTDLAVNVALLEISIAIKYGCMGIKFVSGVDDASRITIGTDKILYLPEGANFGVASSGGSLSDIIDGTRFLVETTLNNNHIRAKYARDNSGNAPSASALLIEEIENLNEREAMTEDTWRPWEQRRFLVDRQIIQTETGRSISEDYSVDFLEPNYALTPETEVLLWDWRIKNGLSTKEEWFMYNNPDYSPEDLEEFSQRQIDNQQNAPQSRLLNILQNGSD
tara:strand:- start:3679 stop:5031 length:1353 start_codon:yes stop_codon:yes gene_type:complete